MEKFVIDPALLQQLSGLTGYTILCDSQGKTLGVYQPAKESEIINLEPPYSAEELERRRQIKTGKPLEEILQRLGL
jgi:hypothetical protein